MSVATATTVRPQGIKCGNCKRYHLTVSAVRECSQGSQSVFSIEATPARPEAPLPTTGPKATAKQIDFLRSLCEGLETTLEAETDVRTLTIPGASMLISELKDRRKLVVQLPTVQQAMSQPKQSDPTRAAWAIPVGEKGSAHYALEVDGVTKFYRVSRPTAGKWAGRTFLEVQASEEYHAIRNWDTARTVLEQIAANPEAASARYGLKIKRCGICSRKLTKEESRERGIGPICAEKSGW